ncbi:LLM class flavin-dependent oxidoreductase [Metabacillus malikii]|uniref:Luciferase family oxidoreductase group 1 n=1 Tax=Metabacillus malikii TaxID=1504265 RepID=A0ABT9ZC61_9BACI|nr:LLM class flavin-dependent oxidoreductase [Metabacillus malikii]MDQ0229605.1 luciferase family oxidoreductase group 1 [Metabacillus malikii]
MKLSILDQAPISKGQTAKDALEAAVKLAQIGEDNRYTRYWIAEHHDLPGLACSAPEVMLGYIGARTNRIRIGSGAILLPHYRPYKVAETHHVLATLFPSRVDLGIGRSPGGSAEASLALSKNFLANVKEFPEAVDELKHFLANDFENDHMFSKVKASPIPVVPPELWLLGMSKKSALLAAEKGLPYAYADFMSEQSGGEIVRLYYDNFKLTNINKPESIVAVSVICAESTEKAERIASSWILWNVLAAKGEARDGIPSIAEAESYSYSSKEHELVSNIKRKMIIGNPKEVKQKLLTVKNSYRTSELMILTITYQPEDRWESYKLIANECFN